MIDVNFRIVCINVSEQTPYYRGNAAENLINSEMIINVTPRSGVYGDVTATYIRRVEIPSRIYAKHQYRQESEYGSTWCIIHSNT